MLREEREHYHETKRHADESFPFNIYPCSIPVDFTEVAVHWHEEMELIAVKKGQGLVMVDTVSYDVREGEVMVIFPGQLHGIAQTAGRRMEYENIIFRPHMLMSNSEDECTARYIYPLSQELDHVTVHITENSQGYGELMECIDRMDELCREKKAAYQMGIKRCLFWFLHLLLSCNHFRVPGKPKKSKEKIKIVLNYIEDHYQEPISVEQAAALCHYSNSHFMKFFKEYMGASLIEYLNDYRLRMASRLLLTTDLAVTAIALEAGFDNISYFNRLFKKKYHKTPGEYRLQREM